MQLSYQIVFLKQARNIQRLTGYIQGKPPCGGMTELFDEKRECYIVTKM
jgi:hypothetical protein